MSQETQEWLETMILIGDTDYRGNAWHWRAGNTNHYPKSIPVDAVRALLKKAHAIESPAYAQDADGNPFVIEGRKAIVIPAMGNHVPYVGTDNFQIHQAEDTLLDMTLHLCNGIGYASAGLIRRGAKSWVQLEHPENQESAGLKYRPGLLAATALDGSMKTTFKRTGTFVECDNTFAWALGEVTNDQVTIKHTKKSLAMLKDSEGAIQALNDLAETIGYNVEKASKRVVTDLQFQRFLELLVPMPAKDDADAKRAHTIAVNKRDDIARLYKSDERAAPWAGSALGVMQAVNTYQNHEATVRNADHRVERVMENVISGKLDELDALAWSTLNRVLVAA